MKRIQATKSHPLPKRRKSTPTVKLRKNGAKVIDAKSTMRLPAGMNRILRAPAAVRWQYPSVAAMTPRRIESVLRGALMGDHTAQWELFDLMLDTWPVLASCHNELIDGVIRRELVFDPYAEEDEKATETAIEKEKLVTCALRKMNPDVSRDDNGKNGTIRDIMCAWFMGISVIEIIWQLIDTKKQGEMWSPQSTCWSHPQWYGFSEDGRIGLIENSYPSGYGTTSTQRPRTVIRAFPEAKFLVCIHKARSGSALAGPMLRPLAWWWAAANFSSDWLLNLAQVFGLPFRWANYAQSSPDQTVQEICSMLQNMGSAGWAAFPEGTTLELKEVSRTGNLSPQGDLLDRADTYARVLLLGQTMTGQTIASGRGGQAFGTVEAQVKTDRLDAACSFVQEVINGQLIPYILMRNYGDTEEPPSCKFLQETEGTYQDAQRDQLLSNLGLPIPFSHLQEKYNIPEPTGDEEVTEKPEIPAPMGMGGGLKPAGPKGTKPIGQAPDSKQTAAKPEEKKKVEAKLAEISLIEDDEVFAHELRALAAQLVSSQYISDAREAVSAIQNFITAKETPCES